MRTRTTIIPLLIAVITAWSPPEISSLQPEVSEGSVVKLYIDKKRIVEITDDGFVELFFGLDSWTFARSTTIEAKPDLEFDQVLVPNFIDLCVERNSCFVDPDKKIYEDTYQGAKYKYYKAKTFVSFSAVQVGEVTNDILKLVTNLEVRMVISNDFTEAVIGMAPDSVIWPFFNRIYQFIENRIRFQYFNYPGSKFFAIYDTSLIKDMIFEHQPMTVKQYLLVSTTVITSRSDSNFWLEYACIADRDADLMFRITPKNHKIILGHFCNDASVCEFKTDLKDSYQEGVIQLSYSDYRTKKQINNLAINLKDLITFDPNDKIIWRFAPLPENYADSKCTMTLEKQFFVKFFLTVVLNLADNSLLFSLDVIDIDLLFKLSSFSEFCIIMVTAAITIVLCYIIYSKLFIKRIVQKVRNN